MVSGSNSFLLAFLISRIMIVIKFFCPILSIICLCKRVRLQITVKFMAWFCCKVVFFILELVWKSIFESIYPFSRCDVFRILIKGSTIGMKLKSFQGVYSGLYPSFLLLKMDIRLFDTRPKARAVILANSKTQL